MFDKRKYREDISMKQQGYSLIELIALIVILRILTTTVLPKFLDLSSDTKIASLESMKGALASGSKTVFLKAIVDKQAIGATSITVGMHTIKLYNGYPTGWWDASMRYIVGLEDIAHAQNRTTVCEQEWCGKGDQTSLPSGITTTYPTVIGKVYPKGYSFDDECGVYFINYRDGSNPVIELESSDC